MLLIANQRRWEGHLIKIEDASLQTQLFYGKLSLAEWVDYSPRSRTQGSIPGRVIPKT